MPVKASKLANARNLLTYADEVTTWPGIKQGRRGVHLLSEHLSGEYRYH